jgi:hypothetical protein
MVVDKFTDNTLIKNLTNPMALGQTEQAKDERQFELNRGKYRIDPMAKISPDSFGASRNTKHEDSTQEW